MRLIQIESAAGRAITQFGSVNVSQVRVARSDSQAHISRMRLGASGEIGFHQATVPQLFIVIEGSGWVCDQSQERVPIEVGQAAFWERDEWHAAGSELGMTALVIQGESLALA